MSQSDRLLGRRNSTPKRKVGTRAVLNGKKVMWNGRKWVPAPNHSRSSTNGGRQTTRLTGPSSTTPTRPRRRGMSNIPRSEGTGGKAETTLGYGAGKKKPPTSPKPPARTAPVAKPPAAKPPAAKPKSKTHTYKKHGSDLHIGRHKTLAEHRKAVAERKKKKKPQSNANKAGWQGNRNY